ncbi:MAG: hypothetical protein J7M08_05600 [Planctomycetes bacterium]|nr:hypothetical protein [Planctomycetota bacterium]
MEKRPENRAGAESSYRELQRRADRISSLILTTDCPAVDVAIQVRKLRQFVRRRLPDRVALFEMVYESRFRRFWEQFRPGADGPLPQWRD